MFADVVALVGKQEDIFLDLKESRSTTGVLLDDDKAHFSKAASGFAHQAGGVVVWGIEARKGEDGIDEATDLKPISNIKGFLSGLNDHVKYSTEPVVGGIVNHVIYENDDENLMRLSLHNKGRGVAKFLSVQFGLIPHVDGPWSDGGGELNFKTKWMEHNRPGPYGFQFMANASLVVHPDQEICLLVGPTEMGPKKTRILKTVYRLFAESMVPKEGTLEL